MAKKKSDTEKKEKGDKVTWSNPEEELLVNTLLANKASHQAESGWKTTVWELVAAELASEFPEKKPRKDADKCSTCWNRVSAMLLMKYIYIYIETQVHYSSKANTRSLQAFSENLDLGGTVQHKLSQHRKMYGSIC